MCVDLRTIPRWPTFGRFQTTRGTPLLHTTFPPLCWIRRLSSRDSGLWSRVNGFGVQTCGFSGCWTPRTIAESPTWPIKILPRRINAILAVVPAVLGRPDAVLGQFSVKNYETKIIHQIWSISEYFNTSWGQISLIINLNIYIRSTTIIRFFQLKLWNVFHWIRRKRKILIYFYRIHFKFNYFPILMF